jgi:hypothetical protein
MWSRGMVEGAGAGLIGAVAMTAGERLEQRYTRRPDSYVPARTLQRLTGLAEAEDPWANLGMHLGQGALLGTLRGAMATAGLRGPWASAMFWAVRLTNDQLLENATGVGAPPWTWPRRELLIDLLHKAVYAYVTGLVADLLAVRRGPGPGQAHAALRPGRRAHVGPPARETVGRGPR